MRTQSMNVMNLEKNLYDVFIIVARFLNFKFIHNVYNIAGAILVN